MRIVPIALLLPAALLLACGRGEARDTDAPASTAAAALDTPVPLPLAQKPDSLEVVAQVGGVTVEHVREPLYGSIREGRVKVNGRVLLAEEYSPGMEMVAYWPVRGGRTLVLLGIAFGGTACERNFRVLEVREEGDPLLTEEFGSCAWMPDSLWFDRAGALWMRFPPWAPLRVMLEEGDDFVPDPPSTYVYRGGGRIESP